MYQYLPPYSNHQDLDVELELQAAAAGGSGSSEVGGGSRDGGDLDEDFEDSEGGVSAGFWGFRAPILTLAESKWSQYDGCCLGSLRVWRRGFAAACPI